MRACGGGWNDPGNAVILAQVEKRQPELRDLRLQAYKTSVNGAKPPAAVARAEWRGDKEAMEATAERNVKAGEAGARGFHNGKTEAESENYEESSHLIDPAAGIQVTIDWLTSLETRKKPDFTETARQPLGRARC